MTNFERIKSSVDDMAWELMEFRVDAYAAAQGCEAGLPRTKNDIAEWLMQESLVEECVVVSELI